jgi:protein phosphatase
MSYTANRLRTAILVANQRLSRRIREREDLRGTGSTVAALLLQDDVVVISNVGDCRVYRVRDGAITRITVDHSWVAEQVRAGYITEDEARTHPWRHVVTRSVAGDAGVGADVLEATPQPGDRFLLCSDGVHGILADEELLAVIEDHANDVEACRALVDQANERGGPDNSTVILVSVVPGGRPDVRAGFDTTVRIVQSGRRPDGRTDDTA